MCGFRQKNPIFQKIGAIPNLHAAIYQKTGSIAGISGYSTKAANFPIKDLIIFNLFSYRDFQFAIMGLNL